MPASTPYHPSSSPILGFFSFILLAVVSRPVAFTRSHVACRFLRSINQPLHNIRPHILVRAPIAAPQGHISFGKRSSNIELGVAIDIAYVVSYIYCLCFAFFAVTHSDPCRVSIAKMSRAEALECGSLQPFVMVHCYGPRVCRPRLSSDGAECEKRPGSRSR